MILAITIPILISLLGLIIFVHVFHWSRDRLKIYCTYLIPLPILISIIIYSVSYYFLLYYSEIWSSPINKVVYYEKWTEQYTTTETDSEGKSKTVTRYRYHPPSWCAVDMYKTEHKITKSDYDQWKHIWGNENKVNIFRPNQSSWGDGNKFETKWNNEFDKMFPYSFVKKYKNKVRSSRTVWDFASVSKEISKQYQRPADKGNLLPVLSYGIPVTDEQQLLLKRYNSIWGPNHEIYTIVVLFDAHDYPDRTIVETIINAWQGPNKNEFVVCVGIKDQNVQWVDCFSWMDDTTLHSLVRQDIMNLNKYSFDDIVEILKERIPVYWKRKKFADFEYISVSLSLTSYLSMLAISTFTVLAGGIMVEKRIH